MRTFLIELRQIRQLTFLQQMRRLAGQEVPRCNILIWDLAWVKASNVQSHDIIHPGEIYIQHNADGECKKDIAFLYYIQVQYHRQL